MKHTRYETLLAFCEALTWADGTDTVYQRIVDTAAEYFESDAAYLHLLDAGGKHFVRFAMHPDGAEVVTSPVLTTETGRMSLMIDRKTLIIMEDYANPHQDDEIPERAVEQGYRSAFSIPLVSPAGTLGMISPVYRTPLPWAEDDYDFLLDIGRVVGIFVHRMQMTKKQLELQVLKDRKQLASEIHDNISQMVSALAIRADIAQSCLEDDDTVALEVELQRMGTQARQVTKVLREEMLSLRTPISEASDLAAGMSTALTRFSELWDIETVLNTTTDNPVMLTDYANLQLERIVNEAMQNVLRHAHATKVIATVGRKNGNALVSIQDNGIGFDVDKVPPERLGIRIMRERAAAVSGTLVIRSSDQGTTVTVEIPTTRK